MMKIFTCLASIGILLILSNQSNAQSLIAVQNGDVPAFYQQVDDAIVHSQDGDTIYIPGGNWNITQPINKRLNIIGVGHHPDSTSSTYQSILNGIITLAAGSSNGTLTGIFLQGNFSGSNEPVNSYTVTRCHISGGLSLFPSNSNFTFIENIIESNISIGNNNSPATNFSFYNNIINVLFVPQISTPLANSVFKNNIFLFPSPNWYELTIACQYSLFENNIFSFYTQYFSRVLNSTVNNNLFIENITFPSRTNVGSNNLINQSNIFVNQVNIYAFSYKDDYHLLSNSPGKNAGTDGTDLGIYGGLYPWKEGSIPTNPHFQTIKIDPKTNASGNLNVTIKVKAQDN